MYVSTYLSIYECMVMIVTPLLVCNYYGIEYYTWQAELPAWMIKVS